MSTQSLIYLLQYHNTIMVPSFVESGIPNWTQIQFHFSVNTFPTATSFWAITPQ